jgi:hypothetical protein
MPRDHGNLIARMTSAAIRHEHRHAGIGNYRITPGIRACGGNETIVGERSEYDPAIPFDESVIEIPSERTRWNPRM